MVPIVIIPLTRKCMVLFKGVYVISLLRKCLTTDTQLSVGLITKTVNLPSYDKLPFWSGVDLGHLTVHIVFFVLYLVPKELQCSIHLGFTIRVV